MFTLPNCLTNSAGDRYLASVANCRKASLALWGNRNTATHKYNFLLFYSRKLSTNIEVQLTPEEKAPLRKFNIKRKMPPEKCPRLIPAPRKFLPRNKVTIQEI